MEKLTSQLSFFNESEAFYDETAEEPDIDDVIDENLKKPHISKKRASTKNT